MNYIKEAEQYLKYYGDLQKSIDNMDRQIARLKWKSGPKGVASPTLEVTGIKGDYQQDEAYNVLFKMQKLIKSKSKTEEELEKIDDILEEISKEEECKFYGKVLRKWYIERMPKEKIADAIGYSSRQSIYTLRAKAIRKFAVRLFGLDALECI